MDFKNQQQYNNGDGQAQNYYNQQPPQPQNAYYGQQQGYPQQQGYGQQQQGNY
jgi:hypothetical protein